MAKTGGKSSKREPGVYTYRAGKKLALRKRDDQFVVRRLPRDTPYGADAEQVSSASSRVSCTPAERDRLMIESRREAVTHHAYEVADSGTEFLLTDRVFVRFKAPKSDQEVGRFAGRYALEILDRIDDLTFLFRLTDATGMNPVKLVVALTEKDAEVERAEHDLNRRFATAVALPGDPNYARQWHLHQRFQHAEVDPRASARCEAAWQLLDSLGDPAVVVGVTDDGCQLEHRDFDSPGKFAGWGYFEGTRLRRRGDPGADPARMYQSGANHGTACAGVIAAESDGELTVGAAPGCRLLPVKWESSGPSLLISDSKLLTALDYLAERVDVLSNSWGISPVSDWIPEVVNRIATLAQTGGRRGKGILFLWAAGNNNCPLQHQAAVPVPYSTGWQFSAGAWRWVGVRSARSFANDLVGVPGVMHVAALASTAQRSHYSNYGTGIDLCAPSSNSHTYSRLWLDGLGITTTTGDSGGVRDDFGGTSSATPLVAGVAALALSANPGLSALQLASILRRSAAKDLNLTGYPRTPPASYDGDTSWDVSPIAPFDSGAFADGARADGSWSPWFGHGRVDAQAAVQQALAALQRESLRLRVEQSPNAPIPDREPLGVVSRAFVADSGELRALRVHVDIQHTYIGDLILRLIGPDGSAAYLHRRDGGGANNLVRDYDSASLPALAVFLGKPVRGTWTLEVSDRARFDVGTLQRWSLEAELASQRVQRLESAPGRVIPDNQPAGIEDHLFASGVGTVSDIAVDLDITHTWIGDLEVRLRGPDGHEVSLHAREGRSDDDIQRSYTTAEEPDLAGFVGRSGDGDWTLKVSDHAARDVGKLNRWVLTLS